MFFLHSKFINISGEPIFGNYKENISLIICKASTAIIDALYNHFLNSITISLFNFLLLWLLTWVSFFNIHTFICTYWKLKMISSPQVEMCKEYFFSKFCH